RQERGERSGRQAEKHMVACLFVSGFCGTRFAQTVLESRHTHCVRSLGFSEPDIKLMYNLSMKEEIDSKWTKKTDSIVDIILEIILFPLIAVAAFFLISAVGELARTEFREGILDLIIAISSYSLGRGTSKYFDYKKG